MRNQSFGVPLPTFPSMRIRAAVTALAVGALLAGCRADVNVTDPNSPSTGTFWTSEAGAVQGINATYNSLIRLGTFQRWQAFTYDIRSDEGFSPSPWTDLQNFNKFTFVTYDFDVNRDTWFETYLGIFRANQVIANVPGINMNATLRSRIVGEAKFIRALYYFHLITLYGGNIPLELTPSSPIDRPASAGEAAVWAQIEKDLTEAIPVLPPSYTVSSDIGRATSGAAQGLLGKVQLQQRKWAAAAATLLPVINSGTYRLADDYASNFTAAGKNNQESLFEVQFGNPDLAGSQQIYGLNIAKMVGACGPSYCDGRPTRWYFNQFFADTLNRAVYDSRLDATMFWNKPGETVYGSPFLNPGAGRNATDVFFKKYSEYQNTNGDQNWEASLNYKVLRYADVLLMYAEALNEQGQFANAATYVNLVRGRASVNQPAVTGTSQTQMRDVILHERLLEFGLESQRWLDLARQNLFASVVGANEGSAACAARANKAAGCDAEFSFFKVGKTELLPIPQAEIDLNPNVKQNPGW
jgi:starch-binding outer membrane protein, SusD/RagB family